MDLNGLNVLDVVILTFLGLAFLMFLLVPGTMLWMFLTAVRQGGDPAADPAPPPPEAP